MYVFRLSGWVSVQYGLTAAVHATIKGHEGCLRLLIAGGADVNEPNGVRECNALACKREACMRVCMRVFMGV